MADGRELSADWWTATRWRDAVDSVLEFQESFEKNAAPEINKYQQMLDGIGETLELRDPFRYVAPYWAVEHLDSRWWSLSQEATARVAERHPGRTMAILCLRLEAHPQNFVSMIESLPDGVDIAACWWGRWDEATAEAWHADAWLSAAASGASRGIRVINLYGGALSVLMCGLGLGGLHHGVGYSESRDERRLSQTGAPPMRYYVPTLRAFLTVPRAADALNELGVTHRCRCELCKRYAGDPLGLSDDELKAHFLECRAAEFRAAAHDVAADIDRLDEVADELDARFALAPDDDLDAVTPTQQELARRAGVLRTWASALRPHL